MFPFGKPVVLFRRNTDGSFGSAEVIAGCAVAPRTQTEPPVPSFPPLTSGRTVYAPPGTVVSPRDRVVVEGTTFEVDGDPEVWDSPYTGSRMGVVINLRRADNWFDTTVSVRTYLGSSGWGDSFADPVTWPAAVVLVSELDASAAGDEQGAQVKVRVPAANGSTSAVVPE
jgi:hypothetical protein